MEIQTKNWKINTENFIFVTVNRSYRIIKSLVSIVLIIIMGLFVLNNTLYLHMHVFPGGKIVSHAHPFADKDSTPEQKHTHSGSEFFQLDSTNLVFIWTLLSIALIVPLVYNKISRVVIHAQALSISTAHIIRGPPIR